MERVVVMTVLEVHASSVVMLVVVTHLALQPPVMWAACRAISPA